MEQEHLHLLIHEEIYLLPQDKTPVEKVNHEVEEVQEVTTVAEPEPEAIAPPKEETKPEPAEEEHHQESPHIPIHEVAEPEELPFAVFHDSTNEAEIELLHKIIAACKIPDDQYNIFSHGFDQAVKFKKALVFVLEAKAFYTPIPYKGSEFLCSKPLSLLASDKNEKAKLWGALQKFVV
ncbi:MAG: hypothetical protein RLN88_07160 [Ekhidna sp.]|uniref:hypothetical protein n=1 Tax=Ekhidna sp. TaxID=2608089 RepID=UPI0032EE099F